MKNAYLRINWTRKTSVAFPRGYGRQWENLFTFLNRSPFIPSLKEVEPFCSRKCQRQIENESLEKGKRRRGRSICRNRTMISREAGRTSADDVIYLFVGYFPSGYGTALRVPIASPFQGHLQQKNESRRKSVCLRCFIISSGRKKHLCLLMSNFILPFKFRPFGSFTLRAPFFCLF